MFVASKETPNMIKRHFQYHDTMSNLPQSDWILAGRYVDGDLSTRESTEAESRIKSDAAFAAAVEEIRTQSSLISRLPRFEPSDDLADRTLQTSLDQVQAIMGAWPVESTTGLGNSSSSSADSSFDWKSAAAVVTALAGCLVIGAMLWQNNTIPSDVARKATVAAAPVEISNKDVAVAARSKSGDLVAPQGIGLAELESAEADTMGGMQEGAMQRVAPIELPGAFSGTPVQRSVAKQSKPGDARSGDAKSSVGLAAVNASAPVNQIWYVSQDSNASKSAVCDVLMQNRIQVQREVRKQVQAPATAEAVEAFYVAATPKQMKLAMSQLSNNADIEMIQLPGENSPIADAIEQQYAKSSPAALVDEAEQANMPQQFPRPETQALAQQLYSNYVPRNISPPGPVPPILNSDSQIDGLTESDEAARFQSKIASNTNQAQKQSIPPKAAFGKGSGGGGFGGAIADADKAELNEKSDRGSQAAQIAINARTQLAELGKYLDESDGQLRQYLILVRGGEEKK